MLTVVQSNPRFSPALGIDRYVQAYLTALQEQVELLKSTILKKLAARLAETKLDQAAYDRYPFLANAPAFIASLQEVLQTVVDSKTHEVRLLVDASKRQQYGYPASLLAALELGDAVLPGFHVIEESYFEVRIQQKDILRKHLEAAWTS